LHHTSSAFVSKLKIKKGSNDTSYKTIISTRTRGYDKFIRTSQERTKCKRNANKMTLTYLIGKQYREQRNIHGTNQYSLNRNPQNEESSSLNLQTTL